MAYYYPTQTQQYYGRDLRTEAYQHLGFSFLLSSIVVAVMVYLEVPAFIYYAGALGEFFINILTAKNVKKGSVTRATILISEPQMRLFAQ